MSATPEQIAERLEMQAASVESTYGAIAGPTAKEFRAAAALIRAQADALIRAQAERVRVLESTLQHLLRHSGIADVDPRDKDQQDQDVERAARAALKGEA